ncbi:YceI family protein [Mucilaginibacter litoreus]|uniref:YceI family protein n=1 Tax=Mucilaginibacter litoreus TaxID=1048221 RepID=A0ABW3ANW8_9SPHI
MKKLLSIAMAASMLAACQKSNDTISTTYTVNDAVSKAEWKGSAPDHFHVGSFKVTGSLTATDSGKLQTGDFIIPISSIQDYDLPDPVRQTLLADLRDNFFKIALHPDAKFHLTGTAPYTKADTAAIAGANTLLTGDFTMLGQTHSISFPAKVSATADSINTEAKFDINRYQWGMNNYNDSTQKLYILPTVNIRLSVKAGIKK